MATLLEHDKSGLESMHVGGASLLPSIIRLGTSASLVAILGCSSLPPADSAGEPKAPTTTTEPAPETTTLTTHETTTSTTPIVRTGADRLVADEFRQLEGQRVGLIANHTARVDEGHLIDLMASVGTVSVTAIYAPEHGVRGLGDAGETQGNSVDEKTGIPIYSLYGETKQPSQTMLADVDVLVYDIQDVGCRFYTFISTLGLAMQAAAEADIPFVVLDRPNPNPGPSAGFVLEPSQLSFIGQYEIPASYGLTVGELALAIKGEGWLGGLDSLDLTVIPLEGWDQTMYWGAEAWVAPSPGLPTATSARLYPGTVLFEATSLSWGRGTDAPFEQIGAPWLDAPGLAAHLNTLAETTPELGGVVFVPTTFTPRRLDYMTVDPQFVGQELPGIRIEVTDPSQVEPVALGVHVLAEIMARNDQRIIDRASTFDLLAGTTALRVGLEQGTPAPELIEMWFDETKAFDERVLTYRLYP